MKHFLIPLASAFVLPITLKAEVSEDIHKRCHAARDYSGCVITNQGGALRNERK